MEPLKRMVLGFRPLANWELQFKVSYLLHTNILFIRLMLLGINSKSIGQLILNFKCYNRISNFIVGSRILGS
jgi:hypothetical protein